MHRDTHRAGLPLMAVSSWQHALTENPLAPGRWGGREFPSVFTYMPARQQEMQQVLCQRGEVSMLVLPMSSSFLGLEQPRDGGVGFLGPVAYYSSGLAAVGQAHRVGAGPGYAGTGCAQGPSSGLETSIVARHSSSTVTGQGAQFSSVCIADLAYSICPPNGF